MKTWLVLLIVAMVAHPAAGAAGHYVPVAGDSFAYSETETLSNGVGNYTGYTENWFSNGSFTISAILANGTANATYGTSGHWLNNQGQGSPWSESGSFTFSPSTFHYVQGSDNQTGYVNPFVWFYINNSLPQDASFYLLNTPMNVVSRDATFGLALSPTGYVRSILTEGNGSYQRNDVYGQFTATYEWTAQFDPSTGYILGYTYVESDSDGAGDGFTWTDVVSDTHTSFALTTAAAPPAAATPFPWLEVVIVVVVVVVVLLLILVAVYALRRSRGRRSAPGVNLPQHPASAPTAPPFGAPPPIDLLPRDQPAVQQVVVRETVKVPCKFCGTLIDSTATTCPQCGAPRT